MKAKAEFYVSEGVKSLIENGSLDYGDVEHLVAVARMDFLQAATSCRVVEFVSDIPLLIHTESDFCGVWLRPEYSKLKPENVKSTKRGRVLPGKTRIGRPPKP